MFVDGFMNVKLGEIFEIGSGGTPSKKNPEYYNGNIPWIKTGDLKEKYLYKSEDYITELGLNNSSAKMCEPDTVLIAMYGATIGATSILKIPACTNQACATFKKSDKITPEFLYYFFRSQKERFVKDGVGGAQPNISAGYLKKIEIELLPLKKQNEITNTLDKLQSIITHIRTQLEKLDLLVKARFVEMFGDPIVNHQGWRTMALEDNATLLNGRAYKQDELLDSGKYPVLRVGNFFSNRGWYYSDLELDEDKYCDNGDLLYAWSASLGSQIWKGGKVIYHYHIWKVLVGNAYNKQFLCYLLEYATESLMNDTHGIAMMHLTKRGMEKTKFIVPPLELQTQFANFVKQVDQSKSILQQELTQTQTLFDSLMQEYFG